MGILHDFFVYIINQFVDLMMYFKNEVHTNRNNFRQTLDPK